MCCSPTLVLPSAVHCPHCAPTCSPLSSATTCVDHCHSASSLAHLEDAGLHLLAVPPRQPAAGGACPAGDRDYPCPELRCARTLTRGVVVRASVPHTHTGSCMLAPQLFLTTTTTVFAPPCCCCCSEPDEPGPGVRKRRSSLRDSRAEEHHPSSGRDRHARAANRPQVRSGPPCVRHGCARHRAAWAWAQPTQLFLLDPHRCIDGAARMSPYT